MLFRSAKEQLPRTCRAGLILFRPASSGAIVKTRHFIIPRSSFSSAGTLRGEMMAMEQGQSGAQAPQNTCVVDTKPYVLCFCVRSGCNYGTKCSRGVAAAKQCPFWLSFQGARRANSDPVVPMVQWYVSWGSASEKSCSVHGCKFPLPWQVSEYSIPHDRVLG